MKIINATENVKNNKRTAYMLTKNAGIGKMKDCVGQILEVADWCLWIDEHTDTRTGELVETTVLSISTKDGDVFATNSATMQRDFMDMVEAEVADTIKIISGQSKAGREFITCTLV